MSLSPPSFFNFIPLLPRYNIGLFELATDAAFAYDTAYRLFSVKPIYEQVPSVLTSDDNGKSDPFDSEEAKFVFNWLSYSDEAMLAVESPKRMNFACPSEFRKKRSEELASRLLTSSQEQSDAKGRKKTGIPSEEDIVAKIHKDIVSIAKLAAAICPDHLKIFGKRASEFTFDELPDIDAKNRKRSKKLSREMMGQLQHQQQPFVTASHIPFEQMLFQQQMLDQAMMGARIGCNFFGAIPANTVGPPLPSSYNHHLGHHNEKATMSTESAPLVSASSMDMNGGLPPGSAIDPQLFHYFMMQQHHNMQQQYMPQSNALSINGQRRNGHQQVNLPQVNMSSMNEQAEQSTNNHIYLPKWEPPVKD